MAEYLIGLDCGGSHTRGVLADGDLTVLARSDGGPGNPLSAGFPVAARSYGVVIRALLRRARLGSADVAAVGLGAAGAGRAAERTRIEAVLRRILPKARLRVDTDGLIALLGATRGEPGIIVIAGTGSFVLGIDRRGRQVRGGGWGPILGDEGSGAALGREALRAVLRAEDGREPPTVLRRAVLEHFGVAGPAQLVTRLYEAPPPPSELARLWPALAEAARKGDRVARAIVRQGGIELAATVEAVARRLSLDGEIPLILAGGVLSRDSLLRRALVARLRRRLPRARLRAAAASPEIGALYLARVKATRARRPRHA